MEVGVAQVGYCSSCGRYVQLAEGGGCPDGHPRSALRDVRQGSLADAPVVGVNRVVPSAAGFQEYDGAFAKVLGRAIVIVPVALIVAFGLWTGYEQFSGWGMSFAAKLGLSVLSLAATVGLAFLFVRPKHR